MEDRIMLSPVPNEDPTAESRKKDHIELAFQSQVKGGELDKRFYYEPLLSGHPEKETTKGFYFLGKQMQAPLWVSSMTGGTEMAHKINHNLARACKEFGMGMGLGSCRSLLFSDDMLGDFNVRPIIGEDLPLYANLGIAQLEQLVENKELYKINILLDKLSADGLIIHVNPLQEWLQPEGDHFTKAPLDTIRSIIDHLDIKIIVKEVGQGMGYESLKALFQLPIEAIDFAANGGTNFARLELLRSDPVKQEIYKKLAFVGHSAEDMVHLTNQLIDELGTQMRCKQVIISGGIKDFLDGYYLTQTLRVPSIYGQASGFLKYAKEDYKALYDYIHSQIEGLALAKAFLRVRG